MLPQPETQTTQDQQEASSQVQPQQQQLLLQQHIQLTRPPASSVIIFKQENQRGSLKKKSGKPFICKHPGCTWAFARHSDLTRHAKSHAPPQYQCPYWKNDPTCHKKMVHLIDWMY